MPGELSSEKGWSGEELSSWLPVKNMCRRDRLEATGRSALAIQLTSQGDRMQTSLPSLHISMEITPKFADDAWDARASDGLALEQLHGPEDDVEERRRGRWLSGGP